MLAYPLFEFSIKAIYYLNIIPNSYDTLNRVEHFSWAFSFGVIAYFLLEKEFRNSQSRIFFFITFISIINFVGLANEIVEYFIRLSMGSSSAYVYQDTIKDLIMNIGGSLAAFLLITKLSKNSSLDRI